MEICKKCGNLMDVKKGKKENYLVCRGCGHKKKLRSRPENFKLSKEKKSDPKEDELVVIDRKKEAEMLPTTKIKCPNCDNNKAYWWMQQTRSGDEAPTRFYQCTECDYTWREYD